MENTQPMSKMPSTNSKDIEENKVIAAIGYVGIFCLLPLILKKDSPFAHHHGKQGLVLCIAWVAIVIVGWIPVLGWLVGFLGSIAVLVLSVIGIIQALQGNMWEAPIVGNLAKKLNL